MLLDIPVELIAIVIIFIGIFGKIVLDKIYNFISSPEDRQFRQDVAQLKRCNKELDRLRREMFD